MTQNNNQYLKCPHCACLFFTQTDLETHMARFGTSKAQHVYEYNKTHARLEHGYGEE